MASGQGRLPTGLLICLLALGISGCWGSIETDDLAIIGSVGLDRVTPGKVLVSLEVSNPQALAAGLGQQGVANTVGWVLMEEGSTVPNAIKNVQRRVPQKIFLGQVSTIVVGMNLARDGVQPYLDYFARENLVRRSIYITTCDSAAGLLQRPFIQNLPSLTLRGLVDATTRFSGKSVRVSLNEFLMKMAEPGIEPITMHTAGRKTQDTQVKKQGGEVRQAKPSASREQPLESELNIPGMLPRDSPVLDPLSEYGTGEKLRGLTINLGIAAFRDDRLVGFLDGNDARGYLWVTARMVRGSIVEVPNPRREGVILALLVRSVESSLTPILDGKTPRMKVEVRLELEMSQIPQDLYDDDLRLRQEIQAAVNELVKGEMRKTLRTVQQEFRSDIFGFGQSLYRKYPKAWEAMASKWNEEIFPEVEVDLTVDSKILISNAVFRSK
ncbi:MAG: Ger(x)C family spore germination protein [Bacillota bacterium]